MADYQIVPATPAHVAALLPHVRQADIDEFMAASGQTPAQVLRLGLATATQAWAGLADGEVACVFGVSPTSLVCGSGAPWLAGSALIDKHARAFIRLNREFLPEMLAGYRHLENYVDARNTQAIRWLRWLGFTIHDAVPYGVARLPFHRFDMWRE